MSPIWLVDGWLVLGRAVKSYPSTNTIDLLAGLVVEDTRTAPDNWGPEGFPLLAFIGTLPLPAAGGVLDFTTRGIISMVVQGRVPLQLWSGTGKCNNEETYLWREKPQSCSKPSSPIALWLRAAPRRESAEDIRRPSKHPLPAFPI